MEGSERRTAAEAIGDANKREATCDDPKYSVLVPSGKSIIEEWRNTPKYTEDVPRSDQLYEERAVDVVIDYRSRDSPKRLAQSAPSSKFAYDDANANSNDDRQIKIKKPQGGGTVRSIPIKDYQASIAHNIGTLRRSVPQLQFESLISEPEKNTHALLRRGVPIASSSHHCTTSQATCTASQVQAGDAPQKLLCHFCQQRDQRDCHCVDVDSIDKNYVKDKRDFNKTEEQKSQDGSDIDEYFRRSSRRRFGSNIDHRISKRVCESAQGRSGTCTRDERARAAKETEVLQLGEGHVGQKVSAYEENARYSLRDAESKYRSVFEVKGHHRAIGVPLVGMHNACGLPVVAPWHEHEFLEPLRISRRIAVGTVGSVYRSPRSIPNVRRRTQPKRKAPQPNRAMIHSKDADRSIKRSTLMTRSNAVNNKLPRKKHSRDFSSFTTTKAGSLSSKNSFKKTTRSRRHRIKASSLVDTFDRIKGDNAKRATLYAKDDGDEAVQVLKSLCLNPLARVNSETDIMW